MRAVICAVLLAAIPLRALAGLLEKAAVSADFVKNPVFGPALPSVPALKREAVRVEMSFSSAEWINAVKNAYRSSPTGTLPPAPESELPAAALQQLREDAAVYPSRAYKIEIAGHAAFVIENDNYDALYVNIFDENGAHIAYGGFDENYDFYWLKSARGR